jgi:hypothetical protein
VVALKPRAIEEGEGLRPGGHRLFNPLDRLDRKWVGLSEPV